MEENEDFGCGIASCSVVYAPCGACRQADGGEQ